MKTPPPLLITGIHRSGSTWLGGVLSKLPSYCYVQEPMHASSTSRDMWGLPKSPFYTYISDSNASDFHSGLDRVFRLRPKVRPRPRKGSLIGARRFRFDIARLMRKVPLVKDPYASLAAPYIAPTFGAAVIVLTKHPVAFVSSVMRMGWDTDAKTLFGDQKEAADRYFPEDADLINSASERCPIWRAALVWRLLQKVYIQHQSDHKNWFFTTHEKICESPSSAILRICAWLGVEPSDGAMRVVDKTNDPRAMAIPTHRQSQDHIRNVTALPNAWKKTMSPSQIDIVRRLTEETALSLYPLSSWR